MSAPVRGRVTVVGLGPGDADLITAGTKAAIDSCAARFVRTTRHPAAAALDGAASFDALYDTADRIDDVYAGILEQLVAAAAQAAPDPVLYAVPGSPLVAERTVRLLLADERVDVDVVPALSFLDLLWVRLGVDPLEVGATVVDGHRFSVDAAGHAGPLVVCQCDSPLVLSDVKLAVEEWPDAPVTVLQRLGLPDERIALVDWADLDRVVEADHLTTLYIPSLNAPVARELSRFDELVHALRSGCPWDRQQTHRSLRRYLLEETHELLDAIDALGDGAVDDVDPAAIDHLAEELGDVLFQVFFHSTIAAESGWFTLADVATAVHDKLHARHPHVFGDATFESAEELSRNWEAAKLAEKGRESVFDGIASSLPALAFAAKVQKKADTVGAATAPDVATAIAAFAAQPSEAAAGDLLWQVVGWCREQGIEPETALRSWARRVVADLRVSDGAVAPNVVDRP